MARKSELERAWRKSRPAKDLKRTRPPTTVLSVRVPAALHRRLAERARADGKPESVIARELIERGLASDPAVPADLARLFARWVEEGAAAYGHSKSRSRKKRSPSGEDL